MSNSFGPAMFVHTYCTNIAAAYLQRWPHQRRRWQEVARDKQDAIQRHRAKMTRKKIPTLQERSTRTGHRTTSHHGEGNFTRYC